MTVSTLRSLAVGPTLQELAAEQTRLEEALHRGRGRPGPAAGTDLLSSYMGSLGHIPLYQARHELERAEYLEALDRDVWGRLLQLPRAVQHLAASAEALEPPARREVQKLWRELQERGTRSAVQLSGKRAARMTLLLRQSDYDKVQMDSVLQHLQRDAHNRMFAQRLWRVTVPELAAITAARELAERARNNFVRANLRLVISVARRFRHHSVPLIDLIQEGNVGLVKAVHRFDHRRGFRFSTYAHWWIRQAIERAVINKGTQLRLPVHVIDGRRRVARATGRLTQRLERPPTEAEVALEADLSESKVREINCGVHPEPVSLDEPMGHEDARSHIDLIGDDAAVVEEDVARRDTMRQVRSLLAELHPIEMDIIQRRFGLADDCDETLDEIGRSYNLSRERVRQIQAQGLMKMRRMCERREISVAT
jgi:RNA polymerase primary sigma factor